MSKTKSIQIPVELFCNIYSLIEDLKRGEVDTEMIDKIDRQISEKFEAMKRRELYTNSKVAPTDEEREKARKEYLDEVGMRQSFRY